MNENSDCSPSVRQRTGCNGSFSPAKQPQYLRGSPLAASRRRNAAPIQCIGDVAKAVSSPPKGRDFRCQRDCEVVGVSTLNRVRLVAADIPCTLPAEAALFLDVFYDHRAIRPSNPFGKFTVDVRRDAQVKTFQPGDNLAFPSLCATIWSITVLDTWAISLSPSARTPPMPARGPAEECRVESMLSWTGGKTSNGPCR
jgi:hypothetical protein